MAKVSKGCLIPSNGNHTKEQVQANLKRIIEETHKHHKGEEGHYRINVIGGMTGGLSNKELEGMGCTVRDMPGMKKDK